MYNRMTRIGVYGILIQDDSLILTHKAEGPYKGLLDLPGGGIEFAEDVETALIREIKEELAMHFSEMKWFGNLSYHGRYSDTQDTFEFQHIGLIYYLKNFTKIANAQPQDSFIYLPLNEIEIDLLTPFAKEVVKKLST